MGKRATDNCLAQTVKVNCKFVIDAIVVKPYSLDTIHYHIMREKHFKCINILMAKIFTVVVTVYLKHLIQKWMGFNDSGL